MPPCQPTLAGRRRAADAIGMPHPLTAHVDLPDARARLAASLAGRSVELFRHGTLRVKLCAPRGQDPQTPHAQDEVYVVGCGTGTFWDGAARRPHRFEDFTDDFATWVLFCGPDGGEADGDTSPA